MKVTEPSTANVMRPDALYPFGTVDLFGLPFLDAESEAATANHLAQWRPVARVRGEIGAGDTLPLVVTPNVDIVVQLHQGEDPALLESMSRAAYVLPDGWPIVFISRVVGSRLQCRVAGSSVFSHWWPQVAMDRRRIALLVSSDAVRDGLLAEHPDAVAEVAPMLEPGPEAIGALADDFVKIAVEAEAEFIVFGIGHPKDASLALAVLERWPSDLGLPLSFCLGASAEFHVGLKKRAPEWAQRMGMEWLVRFAQEPRRMFQRYFVRDLAFFSLAAKEIMRGNRP